MAQNNGIFPLFMFRYLDLGLYNMREIKILKIHLSTPDFLVDIYSKNLDYLLDHWASPYFFLSQSKKLRNCEIVTVKVKKAGKKWFTKKWVTRIWTNQRAPSRDARR